MAIDEVSRIESELEVKTYINRLKYALANGATGTENENDNHE